MRDHAPGAPQGQASQGFRGSSPSLTRDEETFETDCNLAQQQDVRYFKPYVSEVEHENAERAKWDNATKA